MMSCAAMGPQPGGPRGVLGIVQCSVMSAKWPLRWCSALQGGRGGTGAYLWGACLHLIRCLEGPYPEDSEPFLCPLIPAALCWTIEARQEAHEDLPAEQ